MAKLGSCQDEDFCCVNDEVCLTLEVPTSEDTAPEVIIPVWTNTSNLLVNGTILVENKGTATDFEGITVELIINGDDNDTGEFFVAPGESKAFTVNDLGSIAIEGETGQGLTVVDVAFTINYKF